MARPRKTGLDYFPFDVGFFEDEKMACLAGEFGIKGEMVYIKLLCAIYRNGYYAEWNDALRYKMLRQLPGVSAVLLDQIVSRLVLWGFFDVSLFDLVKVLTSAGIQRRYFEIVSRRRFDGELPYLLVSAAKTPVNVAETGVSVDNNPQSKVNKRKINKTLASFSAHASARPSPAENFSLTIPDAGQLRELLQRDEFRRYGATVAMADAYNAHYGQRGWRLKDGTPITDWALGFLEWVIREDKFATGRGNGANPPPCAPVTIAPPPTEPTEPTEPTGPPLRGEALRRLIEAANNGRGSLEHAAADLKTKLQQND